MSKSVIMIPAGIVDPGSEMQPITPDWVLSGTPELRSKMLVRSRDWNSHVVIWECTAGRFNWHYSGDEPVVV
ncbi:MAG TPA: hypothetical protein VN777_14275 [Terriglobales bacterium]|jgi:uncharacterized protein|nr:hypothetical protein [Terriglobales bacterium]